MEIADAMASNGMKELGYEYINMDGTVLDDVLMLSLMMSSCRLLGRQENR